MMRWPNYSDATGEKQVETYRPGKSWTRQFELMRSNKGSRSGSDPTRKPFVTIDDLKQKAEELASGLKQLSEYKYPLDIRRGVGKRKGVKGMERETDSRQIKAGSRTYFFDIKETKEGKLYLVITESRFKGEGKQRERSSMMVFPENAQEFLETVTEMIAKLNG